MKVILKMKKLIVIISRPKNEIKGMIKPSTEWSIPRYVLRPIKLISNSFYFNIALTDQTNNDAIIRGILQSLITKDINQDNHLLS